MLVDMNTQVRNLRERTRADPMPDPVKRYSGARQVPLPSSRLESEFPHALLTRRTWRRFSRKPVDLSSFGTLLGLTAGIQKWAHAEGEGKIALKTSPSGGARHAIELYTLALEFVVLPLGLLCAYEGQQAGLAVSDRRLDPGNVFLHLVDALLQLLALDGIQAFSFGFARGYEVSAVIPVGGLDPVGHRMSSRP